MKTILITGGAGFIGSNFVPYFLERHSDVNVVTLDLLTYAGRRANLSEVESHPRHSFVHGDIRDATLVDALFKEHCIHGVVHLAAESHVDNSIQNPGIFLETNVQGTFTLLHRSYLEWMQGPGRVRPGFEGARFLHVSTDEVYGSLGPTGLFTEKTPYAPNSPYSASKAASDFLVRSYFHTYGLDVVTTNCSNNFGPKQHAEKLIPTIIRKALAGETIPIYGDGKNVRDWLFVADHCIALDLVFTAGRSGETYNIGGRNERENLYIAEAICDLLDGRVPRSGGQRYRDLIRFVADRPGHDRRYAIDGTKIETELHWCAGKSFETGLAVTVDWYVREFQARGQTIDVSATSGGLSPRAPGSIRGTA